MTPKCLSRMGYLWPAAWGQGNPIVDDDKLDAHSEATRQQFSIEDSIRDSRMGTAQRG